MLLQYFFVSTEGNLLALFPFGAVGIGISSAHRDSCVVLDKEMTTSFVQPEYKGKGNL